MLADAEQCRSAAVSLSNYPPGVTGNELEIAGPDYEQDEERYCGAEVQVVPAALAKDIVESVLRAQEGLRVNADVLSILIRQAEIAGECGYEGEVTVYRYQRRQWWVCPACRTSHEEDE